MIIIHKFLRRMKICSEKEKDNTINEELDLD